MDNNRNFDRLNDAAKDSANRQDEVFDRIQEIVKENPETAKQYLQHLTQTSKWELYSRIYGKFAYITLLILFLIVGLVVGIKKMNGTSPNQTIQNFVDLKPEFKLSDKSGSNYSIIYTDADTSFTLGKLNNFSCKSELKTTKTTNGWLIHKDDFTLGNVALDLKPFSMDFDDEQYAINTEHEFGKNTNLWFNVTEVKTVVKKDSIYSIVYLVKFGEKNASETIIWNTEAVRIKKSDDARGLIEKGRSNLNEISNPQWNNTYFIEMTIGNNCKGDIYKLYGNGYSVGIK